MLIDGVRHGFDIGLKSDPEITVECKNLRSARQHADFVTEAIKKECEQGYLVGPFKMLETDRVYRVSPIGVAEGKYSGKKRLILDLSSPHDDGDIVSINDYMDKEECSLQYVRIDDAINIIKSLGNGALMTKVDIKDAFRILPVKSSQWPLLTIKWNNLYYMYQRLPFGSRSSPKIFTLLSEMVHWILTTKHDICHLLYLLDDFLAIDAPLANGMKTRQTLIDVFAMLGIPLNESKTDGPTTCIEYLGIILDSCQMEARLPMVKINRTLELLRSCLGKTCLTKRKILSVLGHLNFAARVIPAGRTFMSSLIALSTKTDKLNAMLVLTVECKNDLAMWCDLLSQYNGVSMFHEDVITSTVDLMIYTDSSSSVGFGGFNRCKNEFFMDTWSAFPLPTDSHAMTFMELFPIVIAATIWSKDWERKNIRFMCDNEGAVAILNKGRGKGEQINNLMRQLVIISTLNNFVYSAEWLSTKVNIEADALSRGNIHVFQALHPTAKQQQCPLLFKGPDHLNGIDKMR